MKLIEADQPERALSRRGFMQRSAWRDERGFVGGYEPETLSVGLPFMAAFLDPGAILAPMRLRAGRQTRDRVAPTN